MAEQHEPKEEQTMSESHVGDAPAEPATSAEVVPLRKTLDVVRDQLERAANFALTNPGTPGVDEFLSLAMQARIFAGSPLCPATLRGDPHATLHVAMIGRSLGLSIDAAIELIDVIPSQNGPRPSLSPQLINAQCRRLGLGSIVPVTRTKERCVAMAVGPAGVDRRCNTPEGIVHVDDCDCDVIGYGSFTWEMAQQARLVLESCKPGEHSPACKGNGGARCNQGYITYPERMMWWRAAGFCADDWMPDALLGLYSPEELGAVVDAEGRPIDAATVELPPGFEDGREAEKIREQQRRAPAEPDILLDLQLRVAALPDEQRAELADRWVNIDKLKGVRLATLPAERVQLVTSILRGVETKAGRVEGWVAEEQYAARQHDLARGLVYAVAGGSCAVTSDAQDGQETVTEETSVEPQPDAVTAPEAATAVDGPPAVTVTEAHLFPLTEPPAIDPDDRTVTERATEADVDAVIEYVRVLDMTAVNKALRAHNVKLAGAADNVRQQRLVLAILREIERATASE